MEQYKADFIQFMMDCGVLTFGDFTLKSGRKSPYFINTGKYRTGAQLAKLGGYYADCLYEKCFKNGENRDALLFGPAYKGIPLVCAAASALYKKYGLDIEYSFNRKEAKDHGEGGIFIGNIPQNGQSVIIVEDVITAGTAVRETIPLLRSAADVKIEHMIISADRMERGTGGSTATAEVKAEFGVTVHPIVTVREIRDSVSASLAAKMDEYIAQYCV